jgi:predicted PurR-regulated permease PerM
MNRAALLLVVAAIAVTLFGVFPLAGGLIAAPALAVICQPLQTRLADRTGARRSALIIVVVVWVLLVVPGVWVTTLALRQVPDALRDLHQHTARFRAMPSPIPGTNVDSLVGTIGSKSLGWLSSALGPALGNVAHGIVNLSIALLGLFFLLLAGDAAWQGIRRRLPFSSEANEELAHVFVNVTRATLLGTLSSAMLQGVSIGIGLRLIGNTAPAFWGIVAGFATLVPVVGNALVWVPAVATTLIQRDVRSTVLMLVFGKLIPSIVDRVVKTSVSRRLGGVHPMVTLVGALAGVRLVGAVGVLVGPTIVQCSLTLIQLYDREYRRE